MPDPSLMIIASFGRYACYFYSVVRFFFRFSFSFLVSIDVFYSLNTAPFAQCLLRAFFFLYTLSLYTVPGSNGCRLVDFMEQRVVKSLYAHKVLLTLPPISWPVKRLKFLQ